MYSASVPGLLKVSIDSKSYVFLRHKLAGFLQLRQTAMGLELKNETLLDEVLPVRSS